MFVPYARARNGKKSVFSLNNWVIMEKSLIISPYKVAHAQQFDSDHHVLGLIVLDHVVVLAIVSIENTPPI